MNALPCLFFGIFLAMLLGFFVALIRVWLLKIVYQCRKRKAIKNRTDDRWVYEL